MSTRIARLRRPLTYANVTATLALMIAVSGGTAFAASKLITGRQIAKGTITAKNIKSKTLTKGLFAKNQIPAGPRGATGPVGPTGATGATGAPGATGAAGSALAYTNVLINSVGNPYLGANSTFGFTSVTNPSTGFYCVQPGFSGHPALTSPDATATTVATVSPQTCSGGYEFETSNGQNLTTGSGFTVAVP